MTPLPATAAPYRRGMQATVQIVLVAVLLSADWCRAAPIDCPAAVNDQIHQCMVPVKRYAEEIRYEVLTNSTKNAQSRGSIAGFGPGSFALPSNLGKNVFRELCQLISRFDECSKLARHNCPTHLTLKLMDSSYGYLCNDGYQTFLENADCLMELDQRPEAKACHDDTMSSIQGLQKHPDMPLAAKMDKMCSALNFFATCVREPIVLNCREESWQVIYRVLRDTTHVVMPDCNFKSFPPPPPRLSGNDIQQTQPAAAAPPPRQQQQRPNYAVEQPAAVPGGPQLELDDSLYSRGSTYNVQQQDLTPQSIAELNRNPVDNSVGYNRRADASSAAGCQTTKSTAGLLALVVAALLYSH